MFVKDALAGKHGECDMVLANPPFGKVVVRHLTSFEAERVTERERRLRAAGLQGRGTTAWRASDSRASLMKNC